MGPLSYILFQANLDKLKTIFDLQYFPSNEHLFKKIILLLLFDYFFLS